MLVVVVARKKGERDTAKEKVCCCTFFWLVSRQPSLSTLRSPRPNPHGRPPSPPSPPVPACSALPALCNGAGRVGFAHVHLPRNPHLHLHATNPTYTYTYRVARSTEPTRGGWAHLRGIHRTYDALASACPNRQPKAKQTIDGAAASGLSLLAGYAAPIGPPGITLAGPPPNRSRVDGWAQVVTPRECNTTPMEGATDHHHRGRLPQIFSFGGSTAPPRRYTASAAAVTPHG